MVFKVTAQEILEQVIEKISEKEIKLETSRYKPWLTRKDYKFIAEHEEIEIIGKADLSKFTKLEKLYVEEDFLGYLDPNKCKKLPIRELTISVCKGGNNLDLSGFPNLVKLGTWGGYYKLKSLNLSNNPKLEEIHLVGRITEDIDLNIFSNLTNLKILDLGSISAKSSYKSLEKCKKLEYLNITNRYHDAPTKELEYLDLNKLKYLRLGYREYIPFYSRGNDKYMKTGEFESTDALGQMLEPYNWDINIWKLTNHPKLVNADAKVVIKEMDKKIIQLEKVYRDHIKGRRNELEILQDARTEKLKETVFP